jgi:hypothetical protein
MYGELSPALDAQREFGQTNEGLGRDSKEWREKPAQASEMTDMGYTVQSSEAKIK